MNKRLMLATVAGASLLSIGPVAYAQDAKPAASAATSGAVDEVVVTARRRSESLQEVPQTVNAVTGATLEKLNIQKFEDVAATVPGLTLSSGNEGYSTGASIRGAPFSVQSGATPTVEFYLNDALISSVYLFQSTFDVGQIEVLRGPQGTLRGRASPSGSITVTTRRPELDSFGGYVNLTASDKKSYNAAGAVNVPLVNDLLALRVAGVWDKNQGNHVHSVNGSAEPYSQTAGVRTSLRFDNQENLSANLVYQHIEHKLQVYDQIESVSLFLPGGAPGPRLIQPRDRLGLTKDPRYSESKQDVVTSQIEYKFAGQALSYVGSYSKNALLGRTDADLAGIFPVDKALSNILNQSADQQTHEVRLSSAEKIAGFLDYTVGVFHAEQSSASRINNKTAVTAFGNIVTIVPTTVSSVSGTEETSYFANLTAHLNDRTEMAAGVRKISFENDSVVTIAGVQALSSHKKNSPLVYNLSVKHRFNEQWMAYASTGSSWRGGPTLVGVFATVTPRIGQFLDLRPEKSKSYEIGLKANFFERRVQTNLAVYHQDFDGFIYRGGPVPYVSNEPAGAIVQIFSFGSNLDAKIDGVDFDSSIRFTPNLSLNASLSYAHSSVKDGTVACLDLDNNGIPDSTDKSSVAAINAASGGQGIGSCAYNGRLSTSAPWSATLQPEYQRSINDKVDGFARALVAYSPKNTQDMANPYDTVKAYASVNLFAGIRAPDSAWELSFFVKNATNNRVVLNRNLGPEVSNYQALQPPTFSTVAPGSTASAYHVISYSAPREVGLTLRYAFGSR